MNITRQQVEHVARLARLALSREEEEKMVSQLSKILEHVGKLNEVDTSGVEPTSHVLPLSNVFREDCARPSLSQENALKNAPEAEGGFFRVPKIID